MTGSTTATEDRDPSPTEVRNVPVPEISDSNSSDEVEPWDERRQKPKPRNSGMLGLMEGAGEMMTDNLNCFTGTNEDFLEDGDLPSLSRPTSRPRPERRSENETQPMDEPPSLLPPKYMSTKRPMNPPSQAGLETVEERRLAAIRNRESPDTALKRAAFFHQLDPPTPSHTEETLDEEGPDDELRARQFRERRERHRREDSFDAPAREDEVEDDDGYRDIGKSHSGVEEVTCFDYTLTQLSQMCGYGEEPPPKDHKWSEPHDDHWIDIDEEEEEPEQYQSLRQVDDTVEQTAIEVEYVAVDQPDDEMPAQKFEATPSPPSAPQNEETPTMTNRTVEKEEPPEKVPAAQWDTSRKNAYLAAMARKAKEEFEEKTGAEVKDDSTAPDSPRDGVWPGTLPPEEVLDMDDKSVEDVYSSFNPMERRKFLRLINSGISSTEACNKILAEREESEKKKKKSLSFKKLFKRGKSEKEKMPSPNREQETPKTEASSPRSPGVPESLVVVADESLESVEIATPDRAPQVDEYSPDSGPSGSSPPASPDAPRSAPRTPPRSAQRAMPGTPTKSSPPSRISPPSPTRSPPRAPMQEEMPEGPSSSMESVEYTRKTPISVPSPVVVTPASTESDEFAPVVTPRVATPESKTMSPAVTPESFSVTPRGAAPKSITPRSAPVTPESSSSMTPRGAAPKSTTPRSAPAASRRPPTPEGITPRPSRNRAMPKSEPKRSGRLTPDAAYLAYDMAVASSPLQTSYDEDDGAVFLSSSSSSDSSEDMQMEEAGAASAVGPAAAGATAAIATTAAVVAVDSVSETDEESSVRRKFEKSGNSYYDGVRKFLPEEEEDDEDEFEEYGHGKDKGSSKSSRLASFRSSRPSPRAHGFVSLKDMNKKGRDMEEVDASIQSDFRNVSPDDVQQSREVPGSPPKRRILGIPIAAGAKTKDVGFASMEDQDEAGFPLTRATSDDAEDNIAKGEFTVLEAIADQPALDTSGTLDSENENLDRIEKELLRPGPVSASSDSRAARDAEYIKGMNDASFELKTPKEVAEAETTPSQKIEVSGDVSLANYFDSTTSYASPSIHTNDQMSIVSGKSEWTSRTGYTGTSTVHTQSSRKRHKGAARKRIAKAKAAERAIKTKKQGWHESIVAAAASTDRVWDPQKGWVDYEDPGSAMLETKSSEKIRLKLDRSAVRKERGDRNRSYDDTSQAPSVEVPFPPEWEKERSDMIGIKKESTKERKVMSPKVLKMNDRGNDMTTPPPKHPQKDEPHEIPDTTPTTEKPKVSLDPVALHPARDADRSIEATQGSQVKVPFPPEWEMQRNQTVGDGKAPDFPQLEESVLPDVTRTENAGESASVARRKRAPARPRRKPKGAESRTTDADRKRSLLEKEKPVGWVESMRRATASIEKDGKKWDPESGWIGVEKEIIAPPKEGKAKLPQQDTEHSPDVIQTSDDSDSRAPVFDSDNDSSPATSDAKGGNESSPAEESLESNRVAAPALSPTEDKKDFTAKNRDALENFIEKSASPQARHSELSAGDSDQAVASNGGLVPKKGVSRAPESFGSSGSEKDQAPASVNTSNDSVSVGTSQPNKYVQLGDTGSVRSVYAQEQQQPRRSHSKKDSDGANRLKPIQQADNEFLSGAFKQKEGDDDKEPVLKSENDISPSDIRKAPRVNVVKEKCDKDDLGLFSGEAFDSVDNLSDDEIRTPPRKDRSGPVDLDELDDTIDESPTDSDESDDAAWLSDKQKTQLPTKSQSTYDKSASPVTKLGRSGKDTSPSTPSSSVVSSGEKSRTSGTPVPKLGRSRRDTSPVHERKSGEESSSTGAKEAMAGEGAKNREGSTISFTDREASTRSSIGRGNEVVSEGQSTPACDESTAASATSSVKLRAQQWESMAAKKKVVDPPEYNKRKNNARTIAGRDPEGSKAVPPSGAVDLPRESDEATEKQDKPDIPAEWKSFFGKKVRAESAAALAENRQRDETQSSSVDKPRETERATFVSADDSDAYFSPEDGAFPTSRSSSRGSRRYKDEDEDSLFKFDESRREGRSTPSAADEDFPDISPIQTQDEDEVLTDVESKDEHEVLMEEVESNTGAVDRNSSFLQRLSTCAAPMLPRQVAQSCGDGGGHAVPMAHLAFLRTNPSVSSGSSSSKQQGSGKFTPPALCGRPDVIVEEDDDSGDRSTPKSTQERTRDLKRSESPRKSKNRRGSPRSSPRSIGSDLRSSSSVASEDFGQKTAYLEALAMKAAVSNPKRSGSSGRRRSTASEVSTGSKSEAWQAFLERKRAREGESTSRSNTEVSKAAEKYAAEKVEEMMEAMAARSKSVPRDSRKENNFERKMNRVTDSRDATPPSTISSSRSPQEVRSVRSDGDRPLSTGRAARKSDSAKAAEELAAARVEAMMAAMSSTTLDEGEI